MGSGKDKTRLDTLVFERRLAFSRERAKTLIMAGRVLVNRTPVDKPGSLIGREARISVRQDLNPYVSRGGLKLEKVLKDAPVCVKDMTCLDIGASTGGFTDCLLQHGAKKVYAVDVGYGQLDWSLRQNSRVNVIERTNIRYMPYEAVNEKVDIVVADTSFISLKLVIPCAEKFMRKNTLVLALIKPQFEAGKKNVGKKGIVRDPEIREKVIKDIRNFFKKRGYELNGVFPSPIPGSKGNRESIISLNFKDEKKY